MARDQQHSGRPMRLDAAVLVAATLGCLLIEPVQPIRVVVDDQITACRDISCPPNTTDVSRWHEEKNLFSGHLCSVLDRPQGHSWEEEDTRWQAAGMGARLAALKIKMRDIYIPSPDCRLYKGAPGGTCPQPERSPDMRIAWMRMSMDQFALERIMLGKWLQVQEKQPPSAEPPDVIVLPSLTFMCWHLDKTLHFWWIPLSVELGNVTRHKQYWDEVRQKHFDPARPQVFVMHYPFVFDLKGHRALLSALEQQPAAFADRVVIAGIESNLQRIERESFVRKQPDWSDSAELELGTRRGAEQGQAVRGVPLLVTLPYPVSITRPIRGLSGKGPARTIAVLFTGSVDKSPGRKGQLTLRQIIGQYSGFTCGMDGCTVCADGRKRCMVRSEHQAERWGRGVKKLDLAAYDRRKLQLPIWRQNMALLRMFEVALRSHFCLQPPGDTLTRSHFFVSVLTGCIPVLFDRISSPHYNDSVPTWWPWRSLPDDPRAKLLAEDDAEANPFVDYNTFSVVLNAGEVLKSGSLDGVMAELLQMPTRDPDRFRRLQRGLDRVARLMHYGMDICEDVNCDAFAAFRGVLERLLASATADLDPR